MTGRYAYDVLFDIRIGNVGLLICHLLTRFSRYIIDINKRNQGYFVFEITFFYCPDSFFSFHLDSCLFVFYHDICTRLHF